MRFARDVSDRVLFMSEGEVWESGTPEEIFERPKRPETYSFVFRVRSWVWELVYPDGDHRAMEGSLLAFCSRQFVGKRLANACQHVVEELSAERLPSAAHEVGASGVIATYTLYVPESGERAVLEVDCRNLVERGANLELLETGRDAVSDALVEGYSLRVAPLGGANNPAVLAYEIG